MISATINMINGEKLLRTVLGVVSVLELTVNPSLTFLSGSFASTRSS